MQPGETVHPHNTESAGSPPTEPMSTEVPPVSPAPAAESSPYSADANPAVSTEMDDGTVSWEASEYIDHQKPGGWYAMLVGTAIALVALTYVISSGDYIVTAVIAITAVLFGITAARKPRTLHYAVDQRGIKIGEKVYNFADFKVFSVITDTAIHSIQLLPLKRFMPPISLHYPPSDEDKIVETLGLYLPYQEVSRDMVDRFMSRIRF